MVGHRDAVLDAAVSVDERVDHLTPTVADLKAEIDAAKLARENTTGQAKANLTRQIKRLEADLAALETANPETTETPAARSSWSTSRPRSSPRCRRTGSPPTR